jgi:hypothetical protein
MLLLLVSLGVLVLMHAAVYWIEQQELGQLRKASDAEQQRLKTQGVPDNVTKLPLHLNRRTR